MPAGAPRQALRRRITTMETAMAAAGKTEWALAQEVGTTFPNVNRHKLGRATPSLDLAFAYSKALGRSIEDLFFPGGAAQFEGPPAPKPCAIARPKRAAVEGASAEGNCPRCDHPTNEHPRLQAEAPHPNDWRRKLAEDEKRLLAKICATTGRQRVADAIRALGMKKARAFAILGAWADWGWYDPGHSIIAGDLTEKGVSAARLIQRGGAHAA